MNSSTYPFYGYHQVYGYALLDDLHNLFPELLYGNPDQWNGIGDVIRYIQRQTQMRFNLHDRGRELWNTQRLVPPVQVPPPIQTPVQSVPPPPAPNPRIERPPQPSQPTHHNTSPQRPSQPQIRIRSNIRIPPPGNSPAFLSEEDTIDTASGILNVLENMMGLHNDTLLHNFIDTPLHARQIRTRLFSNFADNVAVVPTSQQIQVATRVYNAPTGETDLCAICQDGYENGQAIRQIVHCNHKFHTNCLDPWFRQNVRCPVCRYDIREYRASSENRGQRGQRENRDRYEHSEYSDGEGYETENDDHHDP